MNRHRFNFLTVLLLFCFSTAAVATEDEEKVSQMNRQFRKLYEAGDDSAFYKYTHEFEEYLKSTGNCNSRATRPSTTSTTVWWR
jgi:hypothetical protein